MRYLHIGNGKSIRKKDILGIFDLDNATVSKITKSFIQRQTKDGHLSYADSDLPRSFVVITSGKSAETVLSRISPKSLCERAESDACETGTK